jgi:Tol biopolymer transport system component
MKYNTLSALLWTVLFSVGTSVVPGYSAEVFDASLEESSLSNIRQLTFSNMGFEKAGEAYFSPSGETIIFQAVPSGQKYYQIYTLKLSEEVPKMVSTGKGACTCAYFRPDGKKIIFASSHEDPLLNLLGYDPDAPGYKRTDGEYRWNFTPHMNIYEANPDGTELKALTSGPAYHAECAYSPDGTKIVYASNESGSMNIYTMNADGTEVKQLTFTQNIYNGGTFFSPDGRKIIFRADHERPHYLQVHVIDSDGSNERQLTANGAVNWAPYWHPSGNVIAFTTSLHGHAHYEIYLLNITNGAQRRLTHNPSFDGLPVFNNNGDKLMWTSKRSPDNTSQVFIADFKMPHEFEL